MEYFAHHTVQHSTEMNIQMVVVGAAILLALAVVAVWRRER